MTLPVPPVPADADLRPLPFMPLHVAKLRDSDLAAECEPEACWYAVLLWCAAWHQLPAGSLPNNDTVLCKLIGLGRDLKTFRTHREQALRGWYECSDGRLYHDVVAAEVVNSWRGRVEQAHRTECARIKKANQRNGTDLPTPTLEEFLAGRAPATREALTQGRLDLVVGDKDDRPEGQDVVSSGTDGNVPRENPSKGERQGERQGERERQGDSYNNNNRESGEQPATTRKRKIDPFDVTTATDALARRAGVPHSQPGHIARNLDTVRQWVGDGVDLAIVEEQIDKFRLDKPEDRVSTLGFFDQSVRAVIAAKAARERRGGSAAPRPTMGKPVQPLANRDEDDDRVRAIRVKLNGNPTTTPDKVALALGDDDGETFLVITARSAFVKSQLDLEPIRYAARDVLGCGVVEVRVQ